MSPTTRGDLAELAAAVLAAARLHHATIATAESLTGGQLAAALTSVPGASTSYLGGVVTYATRLKQDLLGVPDEVVATVGVVSAECAEAMADGVRRLTGATHAVATTGVAGPDAQEGKPAGTVYVGLASPGGTRAVRLAVGGDRARIQHDTCVDALAELTGALTGEEPPVG
ncbi:MAG: CinA family protein [Nocardioides sp.]|uniref:CinA family protein n=1 Tax=Nocardioides sp. TaxID=35761 RepID=UPI0039E25214